MRPIVILNVSCIGCVCITLLHVQGSRTSETLLIDYSTPVVCVFVNRDVHTVNSGQRSQY